VIADRTAVRSWNIGTDEIRALICSGCFVQIALSHEGRALGAAIDDAAIQVLPLAVGPR